ncbi:MAG TPA: 50S ribosomal protein L25/general stress protein Ctc [Reyranella sp.]|nr:50S ribosomal protein L25/general stress protein Ctc [Reyranella sp.]
MAETTKVVAKQRSRAGKGGARSSRRDGLIPAVIYGDKQPPLMIAVEPKSIERVMHHEGFFNHQLKIEVDGKGYDVLPRDVQIDPVTDKPLHLDFLRVGPDSIITVQVPVHFKNESQAPGIKRGGVLNVVLHEITVRTKPAAIPEFFEVDLTGLEIGHSVHLSALKVPDGVRVVTRDKNPTVASIAAPTVVRDEAAAKAAEAAAAAAAPAVAEGAAAPGAAPAAPGAAPAAGGAAPAAGAAAPAAGAAAPAAGGKAPAPAKK